ncbi:MAG: IS110 family transposase [Gammaproteobacteria bacterium]
MTQPSLSDSSSSPLYVGIDVAKEKLDLATSEFKEVRQFDNNPAGIARIVKLMTANKPVMIVIESTGGLERQLLHALLEVELPVALVQPKRVRYFAKALGILAKTDQIDGHVLVAFGQKAAPRLSEKLSENQIALSDLITCRKQLVITQTQQTNRRGTTTNKDALKAMDAVLRALQKQIESLDKKIRKIIEADDAFNDLDKLLQSVPGVGPGLSAALIADVPELGKTDRQEVGALVGVAPFAKDSGNTKGQRSISGGRAGVRSVLYMATQAAIRFNPIIKVFAERLEAAGKLPKVVIVACMRKLLTMLNAMVRDRITWQELNVVKKFAIAA